MTHRRPSPARTATAGTAAALVLGWLAAAVFLNQLLLRLQQTLGTVGAYAAIICLVMLAAAGHVLLSRRFAPLDAAPEGGHGGDHIAAAECQVDAQVAMLVRSGVDEPKARELVRDQLVRALAPRGGPSIADILGGRTQQHDGEQSRAAGQYL